MAVRNKHMMQHGYVLLCAYWANGGPQNTDPIFKGEFIKSTLMSMYWRKQSLYRHTYYQKEDTNGYYGGWILKKPASYLTSAHAMKRELRANLFSKNYIDCDIENAFPCLLLGLLEGYHPYEHLRRYVHVS